MTHVLKHSGISQSVQNGMSRKGNKPEERKVGWLKEERQK